MFDPKLYREACRELKAPEDKIEEVIAITENTNKKKCRPLRAALIAVAAVAMMVVGVSAANPGMVEDFAGHIAEIIQVNRYRMDLTTEDGLKITVFSAPQATVENRDGRAILQIDGKDAADITDELNADGRFYYESATEEGLLTVTVEGTVENWTASVMIGDPDGPIYTYSSMQDGKGVMSAPAVSVETPTTFTETVNGTDVYVGITAHDSESLDDVEITTSTVEYDAETGTYNVVVD